MPVQAFTDNCADNSTEAGFQFTFFCDLCREGYKSKFVASESAKKAGFFRGVGQAISLGANLLGRYNVGYGAQQGADMIAQRFQGMSAEWQKEHDKAFEEAQKEAQVHFIRCPQCKKWVCKNDWNEQSGLCVDCAPREGVAVEAARARKMAADIEAKAQETPVFKGKVEKRQISCPKCGKPAGEGKFCVNCGAPVALLVCPKCKAESQAGTSFCGECGNKLA